MLGSPFSVRGDRAGAWVLERRGAGAAAVREGEVRGHQKTEKKMVSMEDLAGIFTEKRESRRKWLNGVKITQPSIP